MVTQRKEEVKSQSQNTKIWKLTGRCGTARWKLPSFAVHQLPALSLPLYSPVFLLPPSGYFSSATLILHRSTRAILHTINPTLSSAPLNKPKCTTLFVPSLPLPSQTTTAGQLSPLVTRKKTAELRPFPGHNAMLIEQIFDTWQSLWHLPGGMFS